MTPTLETDRLVLRSLMREEGPRIQEIFPQWDVVQFLAGSIPWPYPENGAEEFLESVMPGMMDGTRFLWAITVRESQDDLLVGLIELSP